MSLSGLQQSNKGWVDSNQYISGPSSEKVPDDLHSEHTMGQIAFIIQNLRFILDDLSVAAGLYLTQAERDALDTLAGGAYPATTLNPIVTLDQVNNLISGIGAGDLVSTNNLSDVADVATSRTNLGVYSTAEVDSLLSAINSTVSNKVDDTSGTSSLQTLNWGNFSLSYDAGDDELNITYSGSDRVKIDAAGNILAKGFQVIP